MVNGKTPREIILTLPLTFQLNRDLKPEHWTDMDQVLQLHQLLKDLFPWRMVHKRFNLTSNWEELGESFQNICLREMFFKDIMEITKCWNTNRQLELVEERAAKIRENEATIQAIEEKWRQKENIFTPSGSQGEGQSKTPMTPHHSEYRKSEAKNHHYSQFQEVSRRRYALKGKSKTTFSQRKKESYQMFQKLLSLVWEVHRNNKSL
ncbi:hypothetical protein O181_026026 [Austropuccinia psidii MF-1]|uniref:Uncharacterized protein n=1 Tax=Austropuccinia psidii MF-1 TaxID=1389203 RepID=A0A9Q3H042_9BASI|nr:hypothetical protein [Austropuccinia psidii MF-1]